MFLQLLATAVILYVGYRLATLVITTRYQRRLTAHLPGPPTHPIVGSLFHLKRNSEEIVQAWTERTNVFANKGYDAYKVWVLHQCFVIPMNGRSIKAIFDSQEEIVKGQEYDLIVPWLGRGLLTSTGDKWRSRRRLITPTFHFTMLDGYISTMNRHAKICVDNILVDLTNKEFDFYQYIRRMTLDIICETAMGKDLDCQHNHSHPYLNAVGNILHISMYVFMHAILWTEFMRKITGYDREMKKNVKIAHDFTKGVILDRMEAVERGEELGKRNFLDMLLSQMGEEKLSVEDLREEVETFMFEGYDTTASGLCWTVWCLACNQDIQQKAYEEVMETFSDDLDRKVTKADLHGMPYLERCIKEAMRIFPPVPTVGRKLQNEFQLGSHLLPKGAVVVINPTVIHRNETNYENSMSYDPDRFLPENVAKRHAFDYIPFSAGPRNCIGQRFALYEEKVLMSWLLRRYSIHTRFSLHDNPPLAEGVLRPKLGCLVTLKRRR